MGNLKINDIKFNDFCKNKENILIPSNGNFYWAKKYDNHEHLVTYIRRKNEKFTWSCNSCSNIFLNTNESFYCSLCDYDVCSSCFDLKFDPMNPMHQQMNPMNLMNPFFNWYYQMRYQEMRKPVIYLYPEKQMEITVQLNLKNSKIFVVYPTFNEKNNTWKVKAEPNGYIIINGKKYPYLFYELESNVPQLQDEGFIVKDEDAEHFLENKLKILGLNSKESTDFITYWLPVLLRNKLSLCSFQTKEFFSLI